MCFILTFFLSVSFAVCVAQKEGEVQSFPVRLKFDADALTESPVVDHVRLGDDISNCFDEGVGATQM